VEGFYDAAIVGDICPADGAGCFGRGGDVVVEAFDLKLVSQGDVSAEGGGGLVVDLPAGMEETEVCVGGLEGADGLVEGDGEIVDEETDVEGQVEKHASLAGCAWTARVRSATSPSSTWLV